MRQARRLMEGVMGVSARAKLLAMFTSERMGGSQPTNLRWRGGEQRPGSMIGDVVEALSWHRALLFKYLCDLEGVDVPCRLMQSIDMHGVEVKAWNAVAVGPAVNGKGSEWVVVPL
jgi:hypothetical protein